MIRITTAKTAKAKTYSYNNNNNNNNDPWSPLLSTRNEFLNTVVKIPWISFLAPSYLVTSHITYHWNRNSVSWLSSCWLRVTHKGFWRGIALLVLSVGYLLPDTTIRPSSARTRPVVSSSCHKEDFKARCNLMGCKITVCLNCEFATRLLCFLLLCIDLRVSQFFLVDLRASNSIVFSTFRSTRDWVFVLWLLFSFQPCNANKKIKDLQSQKCFITWTWRLQ